MKYIVKKQNTIKIIYLLKTLDIGGVERSTINYSNELINNRFWIGIFAPKGLYSYKNIIYKDIRLFYFNNKISSNFLTQYKIFKSLKTIIKTEKVTTVHYHQRVFIPAIILIKLFFRNIIIVYTHHTIFSDNLNRLIVADKVVVLNKQTLEDLPDRLRKKATIIPHGIKTLNKSITPKSEIRNIGYVGRFVKWKGIEDLIDAFAKVEKKIPKARLILQGDGPLKDKIKKIVGGYNLDNKVFIKKPIISLDKIYSDIDILVLTSKRLEGFGLVLLEAMARGIPVIVSDFEPFREIVINHFNGIISKDNLAEDIIDLLNDRKKYEIMSKNCLKDVSDRFEIDGTIQDYLNNIYEISILPKEVA